MFLALCTFLVASQLELTFGAAPPYGRLSVTNAQLVGSSGQAVALRGMSFYWPQWESQNFWTADVVKQLGCKWNSNLVRAPLPVEGGQIGGYLTGGATATKWLNYLYTVVDAAIANGMYVIIDWHLSAVIANQAEAQSFFTSVSKKYANVPNVLYETFNEPTNGYSDWATIKAFHEVMIKAIRANDANAIIIVGTPQMASGPDQNVINNPINKSYKNIMYTTHWYPNGASWQDTQRKQIQTAKAAGLASFITEYGVAWENVFYPDEAKKWYTFMDQNTLSYANWHVGSTPDGFGQFKDGTPASQIGSDTNLTDTGKLVKAQMVSLKNQGISCFTGGSSSSSSGSSSSSSGSSSSSASTSSITITATQTNDYGGSRQYTIKLTNKSAKDVCAVTFKLTLASGQTIASKWNMDDAGSGNMKLPSWARIAANGGTMDSSGVVATGTAAPKPSVVSVTNC